MWFELIGTFLPVAPEQQNTHMLYNGLVARMMTVKRFRAAAYSNSSFPERGDYFATLSSIFSRTPKKSFRATTQLYPQSDHLIPTWINSRCKRLNFTDKGWPLPWWPAGLLPWANFMAAGHRSIAGASQLSTRMKANLRMVNPSRRFVSRTLVQHSQLTSGSSGNLFLIAGFPCKSTHCFEMPERTRTALAKVANGDK